MQKGKVKWFNELKGFGFIEQKDGEGGDVFVHYTSIKKAGGGRRNLYEGEEVEFDVVQGPKGLQAQNVYQTGRQG